MIGFSMRHLTLATFLFSEWCWQEVDPTCQIDADLDGAMACEDCDDGDPEIGPGTDEIAGNCVDEDCDGALDPPPELADLMDEGAALLCGEGTEEAGSALFAASRNVPGSDTLLIGAPRREPGGTVYILGGAPENLDLQGAVLPLRDLAPLSVRGAESDQVGAALSALQLGDDQEPSIFIGAPGVGVSNVDSYGAVYLVEPEGGEGELTLETTSDASCPEDARFCLINGDFEAASLGSVVLTGWVDPGEQSSPFLLTSAPGFYGNAGLVALVRGSTSFEGKLNLDGEGVYLLSGARDGLGLGEALASASLAGDDASDALIGAPGLGLRDIDAGAENLTDVGGVYGAPLGPSDDWAEGISSSAVGPDNLLLYGVSMDSHVGAALAVGDFTGDGAEDLAVASHCGGQAGEACTDAVWVVPGEALALGPLAVDAAATLTLSWEGPDDSGGPTFTLMPPRLESADLDGDGEIDLVLGRPAADAEAGSVWVLPGPHTQTAALDLDDTGQTELIEVGPFFARERLGYALGGLSLEGLDAIGLGAPRAFDRGGAVYAVPAGGLDLED